MHAAFLWACIVVCVLLIGYGLFADWWNCEDDE